MVRSLPPLWQAFEKSVGRVMTMALTEKPRRWMFNSRNDYKQALGKWHNDWKRQRNALKKAKKQK